MFFYLHFGRGFSYLYGGWAETIVTVYPLCDSLWNTLCPCTTQHHISHI